MGAEKVVQLAQGDDHGNARGKAGDNRHGDKGCHLAQVENTGQDQNDTGHHSGRKDAGQAVLGHNGHEHRGHGSGGTGNLIVSAAQQTDDKAADDSSQAGPMPPWRRC